MKLQKPTKQQINKAKKELVDAANKTKKELVDKTNKAKKKLVETANKTKKKLVDTTNKVASTPSYKVIGYGIGAYIVYRVVNKMLTAPKPEPVNNIDYTVTPDPVKTTITDEEAKKYAQTLLEAMDLQPYGTEVSKIKGVFENINADDFILVFNAFGMKNYNGTGSPPETWVFQQLDNFTERNLVYWLGSELSSWWDGETFDMVEKTVTEAGFIF